MKNSVLENLIKEIVLLEITARIGPRTGAFEIAHELVEPIVQAVIKKQRDIFDKSIDKKSISEQIFKVKNPITGNIEKVLVVFLWEDKKTKRDPKTGKRTRTEFGDAIAAAQPLKFSPEGISAKIFVNLYHVDAGNIAFLRDTIFHELVHVFDPEFEKDVSDASAWTTNKAYLKTPREKKAYLHQMLNRLAGLAIRMAERIKQGSLPEKSLARAWIKNPLLLRKKLESLEPHYGDIIRNYETDPRLDGDKFLKLLYRGLFDITQSILKPAIESTKDYSGAETSSNH